MKKRAMTVILAAALAVSAAMAAGCGNGTGVNGGSDQTEAAQEGTGNGETTEAAAAGEAEAGGAQAEGSAEGTDDPEAAADGVQDGSSQAEEAEAKPRDPMAYVNNVNAEEYVELPADYASMTVEVEMPAEVTDDDVNAQISAILQAHKKLQEIEDRSDVQEGDIVNIDYTGYLNGEPFDGGSAEGYNLEIGSHSFIDGFEEGLVGLEVGDETDLTLTFPENYRATELAGKETVFHVTINSIQEYVLPEFDDDFVASMGITDFGNVISTAADFRKYIRNKMVTDNESAYTYNMRYAIMDKLVSESTILKEPPEPMIDRFYEQYYDELSHAADTNGVSLPEYMEAHGIPADTYEDEIRNEASQEAQQFIILKAVSDKEGLTMTEEEFAVELESAISASKIYGSVDDLNEDIKETYREYLMGNKVLDYLVAKTKVVEPSAGEEETGEDIAAKDAAGVVMTDPAKAAEAVGTAEEAAEENGQTTE